MRKKDELATQHDVAALAGVSRSLVSLAMRDADKVSADRRRRIFAAAEALNYRPNLAATQLAARRTSTIGFVVEDLRNPFFAEVAEGVETAARDANLRLLITSAHRRSDWEETAVATFVELRAAGIVLSSETLGRERILEVGRAVPTVIMARPVFTAATDTVTVDDDKGAALAVEHLVGLGHRNIAHLGISGAYSSANARRRGYERAMREAGLAKHIRSVTVTRAEQGVGNAVEELVTKRPEVTAIFTVNDLAAIAVLDRLGGMGISVPEQISVVGFDDTMLAGVRTVSLTTVSQPSRQMGERAVELLVERIDGRSHSTREILEPTLVVRATTAPPPTV